MSVPTRGALYVVATPIGNLGDMVPRAVEVLQMVDLIAAEDTRHTGRLLQHFGISTSLTAFHDHSDNSRTEGLLKKLEEGQSIALVSDAGTPLISDPGYELVNAARSASIRVIPIPGACALIAALSVSGLPSNKFIFEGFLPAKSSVRCKYLEVLKEESRTLIFYESPHRIVDSLKDIGTVLGDEREICVARELTKTYETVLSGTVDNVLQQVFEDANQQRGEFVLVVKGYDAKSADYSIHADAQKLITELSAHLPTKTISSVVANITGLKKRDIYQWILERSGKQ